MKMFETTRRIVFGFGVSKTMSAMPRAGAKILRLLLVFSLLFGILPVSTSFAHEPIIYGPDGAPLLPHAGADAVSPVERQMQVTYAHDEPAIQVGRVADKDPCFSITGKVTRVERTPTSASGGSYLSDTIVPVRFALIELREEDPISDDSYGEQYTGSDGSFSFSFCDDDGIGGGALELYLRLYSRIFDPSTDHEVAYVTDISYIDEIYEFDSPIFGNASGGNFVRDMQLTVNQSGAFNILEAAYDAWSFFNQSGGIAGNNENLDDTAKFMWEIGYNENKGTYYMDYGAFDEIVVATAPDDDTWDESPIIHEYGHFLEDKYSCDESDGGPHTLTSILGDPEFAWSEGYANYFQGAVRAGRSYPEPVFYIDVNPSPVPPTMTNDIAVSLETWHTQTFTTTNLVTPNNEMSIAAMFWDLLDGNNDDQDRVAHGHAMIQEVYTDEFNDQWGDEECTVPAYFEAWQAMNKPADTATAAVIVQNVGVSNPFTVAAASADEEDGIYYASSLAENLKARAFQWWKNLILISDVSNSMAANNKLNSVKTVLNGQVNDIVQSNAKGTEFSLFTFDNTKTTNNSILEGKFYPELVTPGINSLSANAANDLNCQVESLRAMSQAIGPRVKGDAWLFTDGDASQSISVESLVKALNSRQIRGSFAVLGGCNSATPNPKDVSGAAKSYLGLGANATQPGGIVPYLLTALGSGGRFLFVGQNQASQAAEIMRAQLSHSAGAGSWSDYVSTNPTYLYDRLNSWEFNWIDATPGAGGTNQGVPNPSTSVALPTAFPFYGNNQTTAHVNSNGYLTFGPSAQASQSNNTAIPNAAVPNNALYILWENLFWNNPPSAASTDPNAADAPQVNVFTKTQGDWFAISTIGNSTTNTALQRAYQILLNSKTGEIRYQYLSDTVSSGATIGLENAAGNSAVQVAFNDINGATNNMGYKFIPALAQPTKTFTVPVDGLTSSVGFLLTGYSGSFAPLAVRTPSNQLINCNDTANVLCITVGLVQYVQVKVNGRKGNWTATVAPGGTGAGTFSFSGIGASDMSAESSSDRTRSLGAQTFGVQLGRAVTGNQLTAWFTAPNGQRLGNTFRFYDDGAHDDGAPGDGRFGSESVTPTGAGVAYLWVQGTADGESFTRSEPTPFNFQPLEVTSLGDGDNYGTITPLSFSIHNRDSVRHCYNRSVQLPSGWLATWQIIIGEIDVCVNAGQTLTRILNVRMSATSPNTLPSGAKGDVVVTFVEQEEGIISDSATATVTRRRPPAYIVLDNRNTNGNLRPNGTDTAYLKISAFDEQMVSVANGTPVTLTTSIGGVSPTLATIQEGKVDALFTAPNAPGTAVLDIRVGPLAMTSTLVIAAPLPEQLTLVSSKSALLHSDNTVPLTVTVRNKWGGPVSNQTVRLGVSGDGQAGTIGGSDVMTGTTNGAGQIVATFTRGNKAGPVAVTATLMVQENSVLKPSLTDQIVLNTPHNLFLPQIRR